MAPKELILNKIADYLARRDHSPREIQEKLEQKKIFDKDEILAALNQAQEAGWFLPPEELAQKVHQHLVQKRKSHHFIQQYLKSKGLPSTNFDYGEEFETAKILLEKKFLNLENLAYDDKQKALRMLAQRGFRPDLCMDVVKTCTRESSSETSASPFETTVDDEKEF